MKTTFSPLLLNPAEKLSELSLPKSVPFSLTISKMKRPENDCLSIFKDEKWLLIRYFIDE